MPKRELFHDERTVPLIKDVKHMLHPKIFIVNILVCYLKVSKKLASLNCGVLVMGATGACVLLSMIPNSLGETVLILSANPTAKTFPANTNTAAYH